MAASPHMQEVLDQLWADAEAAAEMTEAPSPDAIRQMMEEGGTYFKRTPDTTDLYLVDANGVQCEWVVAKGADPDIRTIYFHGGGYVGGSIHTHRTLCSDLSREIGGAVLNVGYRLAPEHKAPAQYDDAMAAYKFMLENGPKKEGKPKACFICGDSAGGGLTLSLMMGLRDEGLPLPNAAATLSAWTDLTASGKSFETNAKKDPMASKGLIEMLAGWVLDSGVDAKDFRVSPLFGDFSGLSPVLMQVGKDEALLDDTLMAAEKAKDAGVDVTVEEWDDVFHVWHSLGSHVPESREAVENVGEFLRKHL
ncbi:MAG: alpha/beta hydrolase [Alphaproteobacteria bacterium]|nr:alpha/beta hydrolase [Alphaproteobacteria bacterium]